MRGSLRVGREQLVTRVQACLCLETKKEAEHLMNVVVSCIEKTLLDNLNADSFQIKLGSFGKFSVRHRHGTLRKIPFTGETKLTRDRRKVRFVSLGILRRMETIGD